MPRTTRASTLHTSFAPPHSSPSTSLASPSAAPLAFLSLTSSEVVPLTLSATLFNIIFPLVTIFKCIPFIHLTFVHLINFNQPPQTDFLRPTHHLLHLCPPPRPHTPPQSTNFSCFSLIDFICTPFKLYMSFRYLIYPFLSPTLPASLSPKPPASTAPPSSASPLPKPGSPVLLTSPALLY